MIRFGSRRPTGGEDLETLLHGAPGAPPAAPLLLVPHLLHCLQDSEDDGTCYGSAGADQQQHSEDAADDRENDLPASKRMRHGPSAGPSRQQQQQQHEYAWAQRSNRLSAEPALLLLLLQPKAVDVGGAAGDAAALISRFLEVRRLLHVSVMRCDQEGHAAGVGPRTRMHTHAHACTRTCAKPCRCAAARA